MKKIIIATLCIFSLSAKSQEMKFENGKLFYDNVQITTRMAKEKSMTVSMGASTSFKKAGVIRGWNVFWGIFGTYELVTGAINTANGYSIGLVDVGVGGLSIGIIPGREIKRNMWIADGVKKFNTSSQSK